MASSTHSPESRADIFSVFLKIGLLSFGGPAAQIALMHKILVEERKWLSEQQYLNALSFCMLLPGPEAMQLATYAGWRLQGIIGGLIAGLLFVLPGALVIFALATIYVAFGEIEFIKTMFLGVQAVAVVIVVEALLRVAKRALSARLHWIIAALAFAGIFLFAIPYPLIVLAAGLVGVFFGASIQPSLVTDENKTSLAITVFTVLIGICLWALPVVILYMVNGTSILTELGVFFSKLATVTFGGAYAVLAYMAQDVVTDFNWLTASEMLDGLGLAETTPGPLILVTQFVGYIAGFRQGGYDLALAGGLITLWVTFVPCFIWIFAGAPYIERISAQPRLNAALKGITAAVVGVILSLSMWFALHVLFGTVNESKLGLFTLWVPEISSIKPMAILLIVLSGYLLLRRHLAIGWVLAISAVTAFVVTTF